MREIKFRAWELSKKKFTMYFHIPTQLGDEYPMFHQGFRFQQFTGLKDKNRKEIYEGDIVRGVVRHPQLLTGDNDENSSVKMCGSVFYDHSGFKLKVIQGLPDKNRHKLINYFSFIGNDGETFSDREVIGNIYEKPGLFQSEIDDRSVADK